MVELLPERGAILISGPSRSGKSRWAEHLASRWQGPVTYLATGPAADHDSDWQARVRAHQLRRPPHWDCVEVGSELIHHLEQLAGDGDGDVRDTSTPCVLIESLGTWLAWHLDDSDEAWQRRCAQLLLAIERFPGPVMIVVEETGWGVVPPTAIGGLFRDRLGALQQELMQHGTGAWLVVAGRALDLIRMGHAVPP